MLCFAQLHNNEKENNKSEKQKHFITSAVASQAPHTTTPTGRELHILPVPRMNESSANQHNQSQQQSKLTRSTFTRSASQPTLNSPHSTQRPRSTTKTTQPNRTRQTPREPTRTAARRFHAHGAPPPEHTPTPPGGVPLSTAYDPPPVRFAWVWGRSDV